MIWALAAWRKFHSVVPLGTNSIQYTKIYINLQKWYTKKSNNLDPNLCNAWANKPTV